MVVNGSLLLPESSCWPVTKGTFWPTRISASSLSSAITVGVDRILELDWVASALIATRMSVPLRYPRLRPVPSRLVGLSEKGLISEMTLPSESVSWRGAASLLKPATVLSSAPAIHLIPSWLPVPSLTSTITASIRTWARRTSSLAITPFMVSSSAGGAVRTREFRDSLTWMLTSTSAACWSFSVFWILPLIPSRIGLRSAALAYWT